MNKLNFRVWNDDLKTMFTVPSDSFSLMIADTGNTVAMWCSDGIVDEFPADEVMEFTGLKDKNGIDIYEGDIVNIVDVVLGKNQESLLKMYRNVVFYNGCFGFFDDGECVSFDDIGGYCSDENHKGSHQLFIVGNIYENKELLE